MLIDTHVHVWPLDDAPGHRPVEGAKVRAPNAAAPVEWLLQDMAEFGSDRCVLVQPSCVDERKRSSGAISARCSASSQMPSFRIGPKFCQNFA